MIIFNVICSLKIIIIALAILVSVAFFTFCERSLLSLIQVRIGPAVLGWNGIIQSFSDAVKLFTKEQVLHRYRNILIFYIAPVFILFISLILWIATPIEFGVSSIKMSSLFVFCCIGVGSYAPILAGWASNSKYSYLGIIRSVAQIISYEVSLIIIFIRLIFLLGSYSIENFRVFQKEWWFIGISRLLCFIWFASCLAESNRAPFDFREGESELVSGFNTEYRGGAFALFFLSEYARIMFLSILMAIIFIGSKIIFMIFYLKILFIMYLFILTRGIVPRIRYDHLIRLAWKSFLPISINFILFFVIVKLIIIF